MAKIRYPPCKRNGDRHAKAKNTKKAEEYSVWKALVKRRTRLRGQSSRKNREKERKLIQKKEGVDRRRRVNEQP